MAKRWCVEIFYAAIVFPLTAGRLSTVESCGAQNRKRKSHDGSISGTIFLTSILVVTFVVIFGFSSFEHQSNIAPSTTPKRVYLSIVFLIAAITCALLLILYRFKNCLSDDKNEHDQIWLKIKLSFLWIFTCISIFYSIVKVVKSVTCDTQFLRFQQSNNCGNETVASFTEYESVTIVYEVIQIIFYIVQSTFLHIFIQRKLNVSWHIYYSLLLVFLANISQWTQFFVDVYVFEDDNKNSAFASMCTSETNTTGKEICRAKLVFDAVKRYCHPIELEYSLLSMIFLAELWPSSQHNKISIAYKRRITRKGEYELLGLERDSSTTGRIRRDPCAGDANFVESVSSNNIRHGIDSGNIICLLIGLLISSPNFVFGFLSKSENRYNFTYNDLNIYVKSSVTEICGFSYDMFIAVLLILLLISCFHFLSKYFHYDEDKSIHLFNLHEKIIIVSFLGSVAYVALELLSCFLLLKVLAKEENDPPENDIYLLIAKWSIKIIQLYLQVVCILQFKDYYKSTKYKTRAAQAVFLMIATLNFCLWVGDSIFEATSYDNNILQAVYDKGTERIIAHFLFPFLVFFRFESFISFYGIFRQPNNVNDNTSDTT